VKYRFRPIIPVTLIGPTGRQHLANAVLDTGSDKCLFPSIVQHIIAAQVRPESGYGVTWRGSTHPLVYAEVSLELADEVTTYRWPATVAFTSAPLKYSLLGIAGCLEYFDARFLGEERLVEAEEAGDLLEKYQP
jgi:hypothetical protein